MALKSHVETMFWCLRGRPTWLMFTDSWKLSLFWLWIVVKILSYVLYNMGFDQHISKKKHLRKAKPPRISDQGFLVKYGYDMLWFHPAENTCSTFSNKRHLKNTTKVFEQKSLYPPKKLKKLPLPTTVLCWCRCSLQTVLFLKKISAVRLILEETQTAWGSFHWGQFLKYPRIGWLPEWRAPLEKHTATAMLPVACVYSRWLVYWK